MTNTLTVFLALLLGVQLQPADAYAQTAFPAVHADANTARIQRKAEKLFNNGKYDRAYLIFRHDLAPIGDKYAQYMVGFMYLTGKHVGRDRAQAAAWYRLAAERGRPEFIEAHRELLETLDAEERARSDRWFASLRAEVGDLVVLMKGVRADFEQLQQLDRARSQVQRNVFLGDGTIRSSGAVSAADYRRIERRMKERLDFILGETGIDVDIDSQEIDLDLIEQAVNAHLQAGQ